MSQTLANINRDTKKRRQPFQLQDFLLYREREAVVDELVEKDAAGAVLLQDADKQTELLIAAQFPGLAVIRADRC